MLPFPDEHFMRKAMAQATVFIPEDVYHPKPWMSEEAIRGTVTMGGCPEKDAAKTKGRYSVTEPPMSRDPLKALRVIDSSVGVFLSEVRCRFPLDPVVPALRDGTRTGAVALWLSTPLQPNANPS